jgi:F0F1-type ATP synthase membrane subunit a
MHHITAKSVSLRLFGYLLSGGLVVFLYLGLHLIKSLHHHLALNRHVLRHAEVLQEA